MVSSLWYRALGLLLCLSLGISCDRDDDLPTVDDILLDIVASDQSGNAVFVEVKNAAAGTWSDSYGATVLAQLGRHDDGISETLMKSGDMRSVSGKVLMVRESGFKGWLSRKAEDADKDAKKFKDEVEARGWELVLIPDDEIPRFEELIDALR